MLLAYYSIRFDNAFFLYFYETILFLTLLGIFFGFFAMLFLTVLGIFLYFLRFFGLHVRISRILQ